MKKILFAGALALLFNLSAAAYAPSVPGEFGVSFGVFYSSLDPYGAWVSLESGDYAWRPMRVAGNWRPYMYGQWAWTNDGWYWTSEEPWAWAVYHYGRWYYDDYYGWLWIPGYDWAPAWVEWRYSGDVVGWAPLSPYAVFSVGFGITYHHAWVTPPFYWSFVGMRHMYAPSVYRHFYRPEENRRYMGLTRSIGAVRYENDRIVSRGPERSFIEQRTGTRIRQADIVPVNNRSQERVIRQGDRESIRVYRPTTDQRTPGANVERPARIRESDRRVSLDLRGTDLEQHSRERVDQGDRPRPLTPRADRPGSTQQPTQPDHVTRPALPPVPSTPNTRSRAAEERKGYTPPAARGNVVPRVEPREQSRRQDSAPSRAVPRQQSRPERAVRPNRQLQIDRSNRPKMEQRRQERMKTEPRPQIERKREQQPAPRLPKNEPRGGDRSRNDTPRRG